MIIESVSTFSIFNVFSEPATLFYFWLVYGSDNSQIAPAEATAPQDTAIVTAFQTNAKLSIQLFEGDKTHTQQSSFGIFINGTVFSEDKDKLKVKLETWWQTHELFKTASIKVATTEVFYSAAG